MDYGEYIDQISNLMAADPATVEFQTMVRGMIPYAEDRIYRELDLLNTTVVNSANSFTAGSRSFTLPTNGANGIFYTVTGINVITPAGVAPDSGTRNQMAAVSMDYLNAVWNSATGAGVPQEFAMVNQFTIMVGPWPNANYVVEVIGTIQPAPLSDTNTTTFLTQYLSDLFVAASMIFASGFMRDFGAQSDNPQQAQSWESQYQTLLKSAMMLELRKKFAGPNWTPFSSIPISPTR
jgi:hypothetical protein